ncbi:MAG TPA: hypothetical protein PKD68_02765 [Candidatus Saccharibacteria bacterium]|nr:hypothetical protein [Candidatus Saccharibacteria bacterium]
MKAVIRALIVLTAAIGLLLSSGVAPARASDLQLTWRDFDNATQSCYNAESCAYYILTDVYRTLNGDKCDFPGLEQACEAMLLVEKRFWEHIVTWEAAQDALDEYAQYRSILRSMVVSDFSPEMQYLTVLTVTAQQRVGRLFDPVTHEYLGPPAPSTKDLGGGIGVPIIPTPTTPTPTPKPTVTPTPSPSPTPIRKLTATPTPKISGTVKVGKTLTAKAGTWKPSGVKLSYQWYRNGKKIDEATKSSYKLVGADKGKKVTVKVTGSKTGYKSVTKTSKATKKVATGTLQKGSVKITGSKVVGSTLTVTLSKWTPEITAKYQWYRGSKKIKGATKASYTLTKSDKSKKIKVKVNVTKSGYKSVSKTAKAVKIK